MKTTKSEENDISYVIRDAIIKTYIALGPGLLESAYQAVLKHELEKLGMNIRVQVPVPLKHETLSLEVGYRIDILVADKVVIELKSVEALAPVHHKQVITYLKLSGLKLGILVNFNVADIMTSIHRKVNGL